MISVFDMITDGEDGYIDKIKVFDPSNITDEYKQLLNDYVTPNRNYIKASARAISAKNVKVGILEYIISNCFECSVIDKYEAIIVVLNKVYQQTRDMYKVENSKDELIQSLVNSKEKKVNDLSVLDEIIKPYISDFIYVIEITIGSNKLLKYGITSSSPRKRFSQIRADINTNYSKQYVIIKPLVIVHTKHFKEVEEDIKVLISEYNIPVTGYTFKGSTETIPIKHSSKLYEILMKSFSSYENEVLLNKMDDTT